MTCYIKICDILKNKKLSLDEKKSDIVMHLDTLIISEVQPLLLWDEVLGEIYKFPTIYNDIVEHYHDNSVFKTQSFLWLLRFYDKQTKIYNRSDLYDVISKEGSLYNQIRTSLLTIPDMDDSLLSSIQDKYIETFLNLYPHKSYELDNMGMLTIEHINHLKSLRIFLPQLPLHLRLQHYIDGIWGIYPPDERRTLSHNEVNKIMYVYNSSSSMQQSKDYYYEVFEWTACQEDANNIFQLLLMIQEGLKQWDDVRIPDHCLHIILTLLTARQYSLLAPNMQKLLLPNDNDATFHTLLTLAPEECSMIEICNITPKNIAESEIYL